MKDNTYTLNIKEININTDDNNIAQAVCKLVKYYFKKLIEMDTNISSNINLSSITISDTEYNIQNENGTLKTIPRK